jgi:hypothetical protein
MGKNDFIVVKLYATLLRLDLNTDYINTRSIFGIKETGDNYVRLPRGS